METLLSNFFSVKQKKLVMELVEVVQLKSSIKWHSIVCDNEDKVLLFIVERRSLQEACSPCS